MGKTLVAVTDFPFPNLNPAEAVLSELNAELIKLEAAGLIRHEGGRYFRLD